MPRMSAASGRWDRASSLPAGGRRRDRAELAALRPDLPDLDTLFTFMRDAELRFGSLRLRLDERRSWLPASA